MAQGSEFKDIQAKTDSGSQTLKAPLIVEVCPCYVDTKNETGGVSNIVRQICLHLAANARKVLLLCGNTELGKVVASPGQTRVSEYLTVRVFPQRLHPTWGPTRQVKTALRDVPQDCVAHVHTCFSAFTESAMATLSRRGIPFIFTPHGKLSGQMMANRNVAKRLWWSVVARRYVQRASAIAVSGSAEATLFPSLGLRQPSVVIPNGHEAPVGQQIEVAAVEEPYVLFFGYLDPRKQPEFLVRAFARSKACNSHRLLIVGPDAYGHGATVCQAADACGIGDRVAILGPRYGAEKWSLLRCAACLCLPSRGEGLPVVLCEALGAGIPAVYAESCNFPELGAEGAGIAVGGFSEEEWAAAIDRVCLDGAARASMRAAANRMGASYTWRQMVRRWSDLYDAVWSGSGGPRSVSGVPEP